MPNQYGGREDLDADRVPARAERGAARARARASLSAAEESTAWPGVSRPTYLGGLGFGFKWNMGWMHDTLGLLPAGPGLPPLPPPRADLQPDLRVHRELHPAALARRGRARQGLAARARCRATAGRSSPTCARSTPTCGRTPARSCCSWAASSPRSAEWSHERSLDWHLLEQPEHAGIQCARARPQPRLPRRAGAVGGRLRAGRLPLARAERRRRQRARLRARLDGRRARARAASPTSRPSRASGYRVGLPRAGPLARGAQHRLRRSTAARRRQPRRRSRPSRSPGTTSRSRPSSRCRRSRSSGSCRMTAEVERRARAYPWERPLGATPREDGSAEFRVWAPHARARGARGRGGASTRSSAAGHGVFEGAREAAARATTTRFVARRRAAARPLLALAARGPARPVARARPAAFAWTRRRLRAAGARASSCSTSCTSARSPPEGTFDGGDPRTSPSSRELGVTAIELMPVAEFPGARGWGYDGVYLSRRAVVLRRARTASRGSSTPPTRAGLAVILDVVYNHVGASGVEGARGLRPLLHRDATRRPGARRSTTTTPTATRVREWVLQSAEQLGPRLPHRRAAARRDPRDLRLERRAHRARAVARRVHAVRPARARDRRERAQRPARRAPARRAAAGAATPHWADDFHHALRVLLTGERDGYYADFGSRRRARQGLPPPARPRRQLLGVPPPPLRRAGRRRARPSASSSSRQNHDQVGNRALGDRLPPERAAAGRVLHAALAVHADAVHGRGVRRATRPFQFFTDHIDPDDRRRDARGPPARVRRLRRVRRGGPRPAGRRRPSSARSSRAERDPAIARALRATCCARAAGCRPGDAERSTSTRTARWLRRAARRLRAASATSRDRPARVPCARTARWCWRRTGRHELERRARRAAGRSRERWSR